MKTDYDTVQFSKIIDNARIETQKKLLLLNEEEFFDNSLYESAMYILKTPGKLLRPTLVFLGAIYTETEINKVIDLAVSVELLHTASLIHDDIIDNDKERRGIDTTHVKFGKERSILAGDALIAKSIHNVSGYGKTMIEIMAKTAMKMTAGESIDYKYQMKKAIPDLKTYLKIAELKSASLIATSVSIPGYYTNRKYSKIIEEFGFNFGMAFQIKDDIEDYLKTGEGKKSSDKINNRPNVISSIMKTGKNEKTAIEFAVHMNNEYFDRGFSLLDQKKAWIFEKYYNIIKLKNTINEII